MLNNGLVVRCKTLIVSLGTFAEKALTEGLIQDGAPLPSLFRPDPSRRSLHTLVYTALPDHYAKDGAGWVYNAYALRPQLLKNGAALLQYLRCAPKPLDGTGWDDIDGWLRIHWLAFTGHREELEKLKALDAKTKVGLAEVLLLPDHDGFNTWHLLAKNGDWETFEVLLTVIAPDKATQTERLKGILTSRAYDESVPGTIRDIAAYEGQVAFLERILKWEKDCGISEVVPAMLGSDAAMALCKDLSQPQPRVQRSAQLMERYNQKADKCELQRTRLQLTGPGQEASMDQRVDGDEQTAVVVVENREEFNDRLLEIVDYLERWNFNVVVVSIVGEQRKNLLKTSDYLSRCLRRRWGLLGLWKSFRASLPGAETLIQDRWGILSFESRLTRIFVVDRLTNFGNTLEAEDQVLAIRSLVRFLAVTLASGTAQDGDNMRQMFRLIYQRDNLHFQTEPRAIRELLAPLEPKKRTFVAYMDLLLEKLDNELAPYACAGIFSIDADRDELERYVELSQGKKAFDYLVDPPAELRVEPGVGASHVESSGIEKAAQLSADLIAGFRLRELDDLILNEEEEVPLTVHLYEAFGRTLVLNKGDRLVAAGGDPKPHSILESCRPPAPRAKVSDKARFPEGSVLEFKKLAGPTRIITFFRDLDQFDHQRIAHSLRILDEGVAAMNEVHDARINPSMVLRNEGKQTYLQALLRRSIVNQLQPDLTLKEVFKQPFANWRLVPMMLQQIIHTLETHFAAKMEGDAVAPGEEEARASRSSTLRNETTVYAQEFADSIESLPRPRFIVFTTIMAALGAFFLICPNLGGNVHVLQRLSDLLVQWSEKTFPAWLWSIFVGLVSAGVLVWIVFLILRTLVSLKYRRLKQTIGEFLTERYRIHAESVELRLAIGNQTILQALTHDLHQWARFLDTMEGRITRFRENVEKRLESTRRSLCAEYGGRSSFLRRPLLVEGGAESSGGLREATVLSKGILQDELQERACQSAFIAASGIFDLERTDDEILAASEKASVYGLLSVDQKRELLEAALSAPSVRRRVATFVESHFTRREVIFPVRAIPQYGLVETNRTFYGTMVGTLSDRGMNQFLRTSLLRDDDDFVGLRLINLCLHLNHASMVEALGQWERD